MATTHRQPFRIHSREQLASMECVSFHGLVEEWVDLNESASGSAAVTLWGSLEPTLAPLGTLWEITEAVDQADQATKDDILTALIRLAQQGHHLAGRTVLQCMLPGLSNLIRSRASYPRSCDLGGSRAPIGGEDAEHFVVSECWILIMNYPLDRRPRKIASNLWWDTRKLAIATPANDPGIGVPFEDAIGHLEDSSIDEFITIADDPMAAFSNDLSACLEWARARGSLTSQEASLLADVFLENHFDRPLIVDESGRRNQIYLTLAQEQGTSYATIRKQVSRARQRLIAAIHEELDNRQDSLDARLDCCAS